MDHRVPGSTYVLDYRKHTQSVQGLSFPQWLLVQTQECTLDIVSAQFTQRKTRCYSDTTYTQHSHHESMTSSTARRPPHPSRSLMTAASNLDVTLIQRIFILPLMFVSVSSSLSCRLSAVRTRGTTVVQAGPVSVGYQTTRQLQTSTLLPWCLWS